MYMAKPFKSWTSSNSMSWGGFENSTNGYFKPMKLNNQNKLNSDYSMREDLKPIWSKDSGLPKFFLPKMSPKNNWKQSKNPGNDPYQQSIKGIQFSLAPPITPNAVIKNKGNTYEVMQRVQPKGGIQTSEGYIMEDTLFKENKFGYTGMDTIAGMSEQYITTTKFSNPTDFGVTQKTQTGQDEDGVVSTSKLNQMISEGKTRNEILAMGRTITSNPNSTLSQTGIKTNTLIRGNNYANIDYPSNKKIAEAAAAKKAKATRDKLKILLPHLNLDGDIINSQPEESDESKGSGGASTSHPDAVDDSYAVGGTRPGGYGTGKGSRRGKGKGAKRARKQQMQKEIFKRDPTVAAANVIQSTLGRSPITQSWSKLGYGSRTVMDNYIIPSTNIIEDYNKKSTVNTWAKTIDPEHAKIDPKRKVTVVDKTTTRQEAIYWTHQGSRRRTGTKTITTNTYKDILATSQSKGDQMDMIYDKVMKKAKEKKSTYKTYYDTHADVLDHNYYGITDDDFSDFKEHKDYLLGDISYRRSNQKEIIDRLKLDAKTIEQKDRSESIIPILESDIDTLDTKSTVIKKQLGEYDWQKNISQDAFGTDTIQGESHVSGVLDSYGGQVRGGNYYTQDVGNLVRKTKAYESELETEIKQQTSEIESIEPDETESLVEYFNDKSTKENAIASKDYLSKSLELTKEDRIKLEKARNASAFNANQQATIARPKKTRSRGKPSLRQSSSQGGQYKNTRTRGGQNNLGGLVI